MAPFTSTVRTVCGTAGTGLTLAVALSACSSSPSSSSSTTTTVAPTVTAPASATSAAAAGTTSAAAAGSGAVSAITANWNKFFNPATPNSERVQLLQNGSQFASAISSFSASPLAAGVSSTVDSVTVTSAAKAKVKYDLTAQGTAVAKGSTGTAVLQDGTWKVGDDVFCGLLTEAKNFGLSVSVPAACQTAG